MLTRKKTLSTTTIINNTRHTRQTLINHKSCKNPLARGRVERSYLIFPGHQSRHVSEATVLPWKRGGKVCGWRLARDSSFRGGHWADDRYMVQSYFWMGLTSNDVELTTDLWQGPVSDLRDEMTLADRP